MSIVGIWSGKNVLKHALSGPTTMDKPNISDGGLGFYSTKTITHNLGYRPLVRAYYDPDSNGTLYPLIGQFAGASSGPSTTSPLDLTVVPFWLFVQDVTTTTVEFRTYDTASNVGSFSFYYRIYRDPEV